jgi:hypothetical protein
MMLFGLGTHFDERIPAEDLSSVYNFGFRAARIDAQKASASTMFEMLADAAAAGLEPLVILYDLDMLEQLGAGQRVEWGNELDFTTPPRHYRDSLDDAADLAASRGIKLCGPCISNLDRDSLRWLEQVRGRGWPYGLTAVSVHRYGDGTFEWSHPGFRNRHDEVSVLRSLCDGLPWLVTEFGYKTGTDEGFVTEQEQADRTAQEWAFWQDEGAEAAFLYQINDGQSAEESFGIRRVDGTWKPVASTVPAG